jgi:hypothetical protein
LEIPLKRFNQFKLNRENVASQFPADLKNKHKLEEHCQIFRHPTNMEIYVRLLHTLYQKRKNQTTAFGGIWTVSSLGIAI